MLRVKLNTKKWMSAFLASIYALLMVFATNMHEHHHAYVTHVKGQELEKQISVNEDSVFSNSDCWSCHFLGHNHGVVPQEFTFKIYNFFQYQDYNFWILEEVITSPHYDYLLRGPPIHQVFQS